MRTHPKTFHIRFTEKEYERLCKYAAKVGLPKTTYIRHMINGCCPREHPKGDFDNFFREAHKCGTELTMLCHVAYKFDDLDVQKLEQATNDLYTLMDKVHKAYSGLDKLDITATLEQGQLLSEEEQGEAEQNV